MKADAPIYTYTDTHLQTQRCTYTYTVTHTHAYRYTNTHKHTDTHTQTHKHTDTHTQTQTHPHILTQTNIQTTTNLMLFPPMSGRKAFLALVYGQMLLRLNARLLIFYLLKYICSDILPSPPPYMTYIIKIRESSFVSLLARKRERYQ